MVIVIAVVAAVVITLPFGPSWKQAWAVAGQRGYHVIRLGGNHGRREGRLKALLGHIGVLLGLLGGLLEAFSAVLGQPWYPLVPPWGPRQNHQEKQQETMILASSGLPGGSLGGLLGLLGGFGSCLEAILGRLGDILGPLGGIFDEFGGLLDPLGPSWRPS